MSSGGNLIQSLGDEKKFAVPQIEKFGNLAGTAADSLYLGTKYWLNGNISTLHGVAAQMHILSLRTFSEKFVKICSEFLTVVLFVLCSRDDAAPRR